MLDTTTTGSIPMGMLSLSNILKKPKLIPTTTPFTISRYFRGRPTSLRPLQNQIMRSLPTSTVTPPDNIRKINILMKAILWLTEAGEVKWMRSPSTFTITHSVFQGTIPMLRTTIHFSTMTFIGTSVILDTDTALTGAGEIITTHGDMAMDTVMQDTGVTVTGVTTTGVHVIITGATPDIPEMLLITAAEGIPQLTITMELEAAV